MRIYGSHQHTVDAKGRVSLPSKFRLALGDARLVVVKGFNDTLWLFEEERYEEWRAALLDKNPDGTVNVRSQRNVQLSALISSLTSDVAVDNAGRIMLPANLRAGCALEREVTILGNGDHVEIWPRAKYESEIDAGASLAAFLE